MGIQTAHGELRSCEIAEELPGWPLCEGEGESRTQRSSLVWVCALRRKVTTG